MGKVISPFVTLSLMLAAALLVLTVALIFMMIRMLLAPARMTDAKAAYLLKRLSPGDLGLHFQRLEFTVRDHATQRRRPLVRFFACEEDVTHDSPDEPLPQAIATGAEPFLIIGAIAGG